MQVPFAIRSAVDPPKALARPSYDLVRTALGSLLLAAAFLKAHEYIADLFGPATTFEKIFGITIVEAELALGLWMLFGLFARLNRRVSVAFFACFAAVSFYKAVNGDSSCGCLGRLSLRPWHMSIIDVVAIAALLRYRPAPKPERSATSTGLRLLAFITVLFWPGLTLAFLMDRPVAGTRPVVLRPDDWRGRCLPLLPHIDIGARLAEGQWTVIFYRPNCEACRAAIATYGERTRASKSGPGTAGLALIEVPPYGERVGGEAFRGTPFVLGRLGNSRNWSVRTPTEIALQDCIVVRPGSGNGK